MNAPALSDREHTAKKPQPTHMNRQKLVELLQSVQSGLVSIDEAAAALRLEPVGDLGFAKIDQHRRLRCGFPEVVFAEGKTVEQLIAIVERITAIDAGCLVTRVQPQHEQPLISRWPHARLDAVGRTFWNGAEPETRSGRVTIITAGTSDLPVALEARTTIDCMGCNSDFLVDVGVAGLHRLLRYEPTFTSADCIVVVAGMEGALPSVVGGLVDCPVIAVPTSVGYGASFKGVAALLGMLSSCAANVAVVNIDAGFCGGYVAATIARRAAPNRMA